MSKTAQNGAILYFTLQSSMAKRLDSRSKTALLIASAVFAIVTVALIMNWSTEEEAFLGNVALFSLINLNLLALFALAVIVGRNVIKLLFERKKGILGAKLRSRLVGSFVLIALVPMALSFIVSSGLIHQAVEGWFSSKVESLVASSLSLARQYVAQTKMAVRSASDRVRRELVQTGRWQEADSPYIRSLLESLRLSSDLYSLRIIKQDGTVINEAAHATASVDSFAEPPVDRDVLSKLNPDKPLLRLEERGASQFVRLYQRMEDDVLVTSFRMNPEMAHAQSIVHEAYTQYGDLKAVKTPLRTNFFIILALFNLLTLFGAIWVAFFISKQITGPIQALAEGTRSVARGDYEFHLPQPIRDDEIGYLMESFNRMVLDLQSSRKEADQRGGLIEGIVSNLGVGVIALDVEKRVTAMNQAARSFLQIDQAEPDLQGCELCQIVDREQYQQFAPLIESLSSLESKADKAATAETEIRLRKEARELLLVCTAGHIRTHSGLSIGYVLLLDDVTELSRSQHLAAWRDVARRIAHEIKNPLTPLQLSAQRLERLLQSTEVSAAASESVRSIVEHVEIIKRLANEFSEYGRMPTAQFAPSDLDVLVRSTFEVFRVDNPDIHFRYVGKRKVPEMLLDPEQIRGVLINIFTNAVAAVHSVGTSLPTPEILVVLDYDRDEEKARIEIADSGPGIAPADKNKVFEPYFTTKKGGTGLGLAIVSSIIADHQGGITVLDNSPQGTRFLISLPRHPQPTTLRRLGVN